MRFRPVLSIRTIGKMLDILGGGGGKGQWPLALSPAPYHHPCGEMPERLKGHDWKSCERLKNAPRVRIPLSPPFQYLRAPGRGAQSLGCDRFRGCCYHLPVEDVEPPRSLLPQPPTVSSMARVTELLLYISSAESDSHEQARVGMADAAGESTLCRGYEEGWGCLLSSLRFRTNQTVHPHPAGLTRASACGSSLIQMRGSARLSM